MLQLKSILGAHSQKPQENIQQKLFPVTLTLHVGHSFAN